MRSPSLLAHHGFDVAGKASDGPRRSSRAPSSRRTSSCSTCRCRASTASRRCRCSARPPRSCEVVVLTASGTEDNLLAAIRGGAAGYLLKSEPPERIAEFLRGVGRGEAALSGEIARRLLEQVREGGGRARRSRLDRARAERPRARGAAPARRASRHRRDRERLFISEHTVRSHVKSLLRKLGVSSRREALERSRPRGAESPIVGECSSPAGDAPGGAEPILGDSFSFRRERTVARVLPRRRRPAR